MIPDIDCDCCRWKRNTAAGFPRAWDGNWRGGEPWNNHSSVRTRHPRRLAGSRSMRPKYNAKKGR